MSNKFVFNPITGNFDLINDGGASWLLTVATEADLPLTDNDGSVRVVLATERVYVFNSGTSKWIDSGFSATTFSSSGSATGLTETNANTGNVTKKYLALTKANATQPGGISADAQTIGGIKTFNAAIYAAGGVDVAATGGTDTLNIGATNADVINIGRSGITINLIGDTIYEHVTDLQVTDKTITVNKDGIAGSGSAVGIEVEEAGSATGYTKTSGDRNSWSLKAPNTAGIATVTPGASGITLDQSSHSPVTLAAVGSSPNANAASLSTQALTLQPADATNPGVITAGTQTIGGDKTLSGTTTLGSLTGPLKGSSGVVSASSVVLTSEVTGILPVANGGTNSNSALNNNRVMKSSGGTIIEAAAITASRALVSDSNGIPTQSVTTSAELAFVNGVTSAIQTQLNGKQASGSYPTASAGDLNETSFTAADNQSSAADVTGFAFANAGVRSFEASVSVLRAATYSKFELMGIQKGSSWDLAQALVGDETGIVFSITNAGQIQYTTTSTGSGATVKFRAITTSV